MDTLNFEQIEQIELIKKFEKYIEKEEVNIFWHDINSCSLCYDRICVRCSFSFYNTTFGCKYNDYTKKKIDLLKSKYPDYFI